MAVAFMGNRAQADILRTLATEGPCTIGSLLRHLDMSRASVNKHLVTLEETGLVRGDPPTGKRHGRSVVYAIDENRIQVLANRYIQYVTGRD